MSVRPFIPLVVVVLSLTACESDNSPKENDSYSNIKHIMVQESASRYTAWPAIASVGDSVLVTLYTDTDEHMGPDGRIVAVRSTDDGVTWTVPYVVYDTPLDERESGLTSLSDGSLLVHVWSTMHTPQSYAAMGQGSYFAPVVKSWVEHVSTDEYKAAAGLAGGHLLRSTDGGLSWSEAVPGPDTIHGGVELQDGRIMVASYRETRDYISIQVADEWTGPWTVAAEIRSPQPDSVRMGEPSIAQLPSGRILVMMRATTKPYNDSDDRCFLWEVYSDDGGVSWTKPFETSLWGFPPHLLVLRDGRAVVTYGYRRLPFGQRAGVSVDGITWQKLDEIVLRDDATNKDLGYPASVQLTDDRILTVYYQSHASDTLRPAEGPSPDRHKPDIQAAIWSAH